MPPLPQSKIDAILTHAARRLTATESGRALGVRKDTVLKYRRQFFNTVDAPRCDCGRSIMHTGQCAVRARQRNILGSNDLIAQYGGRIAGARLVHGYAHE